MDAALTGTAIPLAPGCRTVLAGRGTATAKYCWGADATGAGIVNAEGALTHLDTLTPAG